MSRLDGCYLVCLRLLFTFFTQICGIFSLNAEEKEFWKSQSSDTIIVRSVSENILAINARRKSL